MGRRSVTTEAYKAIISPRCIPNPAMVVPLMLDEDVPEKL